MVTEYKILMVSNNSTNMEQQVNAEIAKGWQPYGDLHVVGEGPISLFQVMVKGEQSVYKTILKDAGIIG